MCLEMAIGKDSSLLVFIRAPVKGRVKSRLALSLDGEIVVDLYYRNFILDVLDAGKFSRPLCS